MTQTAVQWLIEHDYLIRTTKWKDIIEQALQMEQEQHGKTWDDAIEAYLGRGHNALRAISDFDEYYEAQYGRHSE